MQESPKQPKVVLTVFVLSLALSCGTTNSAQGLADIARQERERKQQQPSRAAHVYTNDDLKRPHILSPEDDARVAAAQKSATDPNAQASAVPVSVPSPSASASSDEVSTETTQPLTVPAKMPVLKTHQDRPEPQSFLETKISHASSAAPAAVPAPGNPARTDAIQPLAVPAKMPVLKTHQDRPAPQSSLETKISHASSAAPAAVPAPGNPARTDAIQPLAVPAKMPVLKAHQDRPEPQSFLETKISHASSAAPAAVPAPGNPVRADAIQPLAVPAKMPVLKTHQDRPELQSSLETKISHASSVAPAAVPAPGNPARTDAIQPLAVPAKMPVLKAHQDRPELQSSLETKISHASSVAPGSASVIRESLPAIAVTTISTATTHERNIETVKQEEVLDPGTRVRVQPGDSLWKLAEQHLGSGARWQELAVLNPELSNPDHVEVGAWIRLPSVEVASTRKIVVRPGDTLWSVAQAEFGNPLAFSCIAHANPNVQSADLIRAGEALVMPETCAVAR